MSVPPAEVPFRRTFARLLAFLRPYRSGVAVSILLAVGSQACQVALIWVTGRRVVDGPILHRNTHGLWLDVGLIAGLGALSGALMLGRRLLPGQQSLDVEMHMRQGLHSHRVRL